MSSLTQKNILFLELKAPDYLSASLYMERPVVQFNSCNAGPVHSFSRFLQNLQSRFVGRQAGSNELRKPGFRSSLWITHRRSLTAVSATAWSRNFWTRV
mmetsp:Transcript_28598/g.51853  ORF Transcript_28598/g.51853 Transcript_28598/m.51853 type:complete len:99 (-) Transcript_28598:1654-1950(-)